MTQPATQIADKPTMLTVPQLSKLGYLPDRATRRLISEGALKTVKIGNRHYVNLEMFLRYLNGEQSEV